MPRADFYRRIFTLPGDFRPNLLSKRSARCGLNNSEPGLLGHHIGRLVRSWGNLRFIGLLDQRFWKITTRLELVPSLLFFIPQQWEVFVKGCV